MKCVKRIPPDKTKTMAEVRAKLEKEIIEKKILREIPIVFKELHDKANPKTFLKAYNSDEEMLRDIRNELGSIATQIDGGVGATIPLPKK